MTVTYEPARNPKMTAPGKSARLVFVISDLHLGGEAEEGPPPSPNVEPSKRKRGFRICTHEAELAEFINALAGINRAAVELVINGDMVDFLAERTGNDEKQWSPFHYPESVALARFADIIRRSAVVFNALKGFVTTPNHRLVILPGNHDLELNLPAVRRRLREAVGATGAADYEFIAHGEAYRVGDVLIEHGNRLDDMNFADYAVMRHLCGLLSRGMAVDPKFEFRPPAGSELVAQVMNDLKKDYGFIDLLKPEAEAAFPVILALAPERRSKLVSVAWMLYKGKQRRKEQLRRYESNISAVEADAGSRKAIAPKRRSDPLGDLLEKTVHRRDFAKPARTQRRSTSGTSEISLLDQASTLLALLKGKPEECWDESRLFDLRDALLAFQGQNCFDQLKETDVKYLEGAEALAFEPIRHVVFGHTHLAKRVKLTRGGYYFNSGTWADLLELPRAILDQSRTLLPLADLKAFVKDLVIGDYTKHQIFHPTYVRFVQDTGGNSVEAKLVDYRPGDPVS